SYAGNPTSDGSAWTAEGNCNQRVVRDGSWFGDEQPRSAARGKYDKKNHGAVLGFRVGRMLESLLLYLWGPGTTPLTDSSGRSRTAIKAKCRYRPVGTRSALHTPSGR